MIVMAHGTWNKRQAKLANNNREIKAITQGLRCFSKVLKNSRIQSLIIRNDTRVKNETADAQSRLSRAGDSKLKEMIFEQTYLQMNLNRAIDLFLQHFNNLLPRFMSIIGERREIAIEALSQHFGRRSEKNVCNDNSSTIIRPDMVHRTGKRECSILYAWLKQRNSGIRNIVNEEEFETPFMQKMLFPAGPNARKG
ncbi:MAG: hypothetical protein EZS28_036218 [Streblomastix strix]|uniref:Uncharacterized protein n=1 Tax=Streblomastix strix TaxID=222440 RepID=A0A5J4UDF1_9EUKA|nr:MAG: hypothetical protein EZS28_036218 [Streblomastix strix]